ncbi:MAG: DUF2927 domain-containing protein [Pseudomonadota bacterium]
MAQFRHLALVFLTLVLVACGGTPGRELPYLAGEQPSFPGLGAALPAGDTAWSNRSLAKLFTRLTHDMEWGASRPHLVRFEGPVTVALQGQGSGQYVSFLDGYLTHLREQTGIDIARRQGSPNLSVRFVEGRRFRKLLPTVSCLVAPGDIDFATFVDDPREHGGDALARLDGLESITIFIPLTAPPYLVRGCLIEEIAQGLGPANDIYGVGASIFNDDAAHIWPTKLDLLMLEVLYDPGLSTGLDRRETESRALAVLDRLNPSGRGAPELALPAQTSLQSWRDLLQTVFARDARPIDRLDRARRALNLARRTAEGGPQHCHSLLALGRASIAVEPADAIAILDRAEGLCAQIHGGEDIRIARLKLEKASAHLRLGQPAETLALTGDLAEDLAGHGQDERLATLYALRAHALEALGQQGRAAATRQLAQAWGGYALGADNESLIAWLER